MYAQYTQKIAAVKALQGNYKIWWKGIWKKKEYHLSIWLQTIQASTKNTDGNSCVWCRETGEIICQGCISTESKIAICRGDRSTAVRYYRRRILREYVSSFGSAPQNKKNNKIRKHAKNRNWQRATRLRLRQSLCQFQCMFPDFYFSKFYFEVAASANTSPQKHFRKNFVWYIFHPRKFKF